MQKLVVGLRTVSGEVSTLSRAKSDLRSTDYQGSISIKHPKPHVVLAPHYHVADYPRRPVPPRYPRAAHLANVSGYNGKPPMTTYAVATASPSNRASRR